MLYCVIVTSYIYNRKSAENNLHLHSSHDAANRVGFDYIPIPRVEHESPRVWASGTFCHRRYACNITCSLMNHLQKAPKSMVNPWFSYNLDLNLFILCDFYLNFNNFAVISLIRTNFPTNHGRNSCAITSYNKNSAFHYFSISLLPYFLLVVFVSLPRRHRRRGVL